MKKTTFSILALAGVFVMAAAIVSAELSGDFDHDGDVDADDLTVFSENYGKTDDSCIDNDNCSPDYYCAKDSGRCDAVGNCTPKPSNCLQIWDPVCGCEGKTYSNACAAAAAGVNVRYSGECPIPEQFKLGETISLRPQETKYNAEENIRIKFEGVLSDNRCPIDVQCVWQGNAEVEFTFSKDHKGTTFTLNTGIEPSEIILFGYKIKLEKLEPPVLANYPPDQKDYIAYLVITSSEIICFDNDGCDSDSFCAKETGDCSGSGKCMARPAVCTQNWNPVCGCDSLTYYNACLAHKSGVNVAYKGRCGFGKCDDGSQWLCLMMPPECSEFELLALQNGCWVCVNPATCKPWGEPGCSDDKDCPSGMRCDFCGTSSCPFCDDCVPACVPE